MSDKLGFTALSQAAVNEWSETCKLLLENRAEADRYNVEGRAPLHLAVSIGNLETVKILVEYPSGMARELRKWIVTIICEKLKVLPHDLAYLVTEFAVPTCTVLTKDHKGKTALDIAREKGLDKIVEYLLPMIDNADTKIVNDTTSVRSTLP